MSSPLEITVEPHRADDVPSELAFLQSPARFRGSDSRRNSNAHNLQLAAAAAAAANVNSTSNPGSNYTSDDDFDGSGGAGATNTVGTGSGVNIVGTGSGTGNNSSSNPNSRRSSGLPHQNNQNQNNPNGLQPILSTNPSPVTLSSIIPSHIIASSSESELISKLIGGGVFIKHGTHGSPHFRMVWVDSALNFIHWGELAIHRPSSHSLPIKELLEVRSGASSTVLSRQGSNKNFHASRCFQLIFSSRTLDLECVSPYDVQSWISCFLCLKIVLNRPADMVLPPSRPHSPHNESKDLVPGLGGNKSTNSSARSSPNAVVNRRLSHRPHLPGQTHSNDTLSNHHSSHSHSLHPNASNNLNSPNLSPPVNNSNLSPNPPANNNNNNQINVNSSRPGSLSGPGGTVSLSPEDENLNLKNEIQEANDANLHLTDLVELLRAELDAAKIEISHLKAKYEPVPADEDSDARPQELLSPNSLRPVVPLMKGAAADIDAVNHGLLVDANNVHLVPADDEEERMLEQLLEPI